MVKLEGWKAKVVITAALIQLISSGLVLLVFMLSLLIH